MSRLPTNVCANLSAASLHMDGDWVMRALHKNVIVLVPP